MKRRSDYEPKHDGLTLIEIIDRFRTDEQARAHLEEIRWGNGIVCPKCKCSDQSKFSSIKANSRTKVRAGLRYCAECKRQFTVTVGTIFEDSHIPLRKWVIAWYLLCSSKKGISSLQIQRLLDLGSYRTALFMMHRIRHALLQPIFQEKLSGTIEADETYVGGKNIGKGWARKMDNKTPVVALVQRGSDVRAQVMDRTTGHNLKKMIRENVLICSERIRKVSGANFWPIS
jgi:transposase-like protein